MPRRKGKEDDANKAKVKGSKRAKRNQKKAQAERKDAERKRKRENKPTPVGKAANW